MAHLLGMDLPTQTTPQLLTQREVAQLLGLPERTLEDWRLTHSGEIDHAAPQAGPSHTQKCGHSFVLPELPAVVTWERQSCVGVTGLTLRLGFVP